MQHHEVGTAGQAEIDIRFGTLLEMADKLMLYKYVDQEHRPGRGQDGHVHAQAALRRQRLRHALPPVALEGRLAAVLRRGRLRGPVRHRPATTSAACSSTRRRCWRSPTRRSNSYHRLVPGFEAPVNLVYSQRNRSACVRIPITGTNPKAKRIEFRVPDPSCNPYLAFAAMLMAGLDGIKNKIEPPEPVDKDLYELPPDEAPPSRRCPARWTRCSTPWRRDHDFLAEGGVFTAGPDRDLAGLQADRRARPDPAAPAPARVRALLRRLTAGPPGSATFPETGVGLDEPSSRWLSLLVVVEQRQPEQNRRTARHRDRCRAVLCWSE